MAYYIVIDKKVANGFPTEAVLAHFKGCMEMNSEQFNPSPEVPLTLFGFNHFAATGGNAYDGFNRLFKCPRREGRATSFII